MMFEIIYCVFKINFFWKFLNSKFKIFLRSFTTCLRKLFDVGTLVSFNQMKSQKICRSFTLISNGYTFPFISSSQVKQVLIFLITFCLKFNVNSQIKLEMKLFNAQGIMLTLKESCISRVNDQKIIFRMKTPSQWCLLWQEI
jgi:hypothetical protein